MPKAGSALLARTALGTLTIWLITGCQVVGPESISLGRGAYNNRTQQTAMEQTLLNIVRVHKNEQTMFFDISEIDAVVTAQAQLGGTIGGIGTSLLNGIKGIFTSSTQTDIEVKGANSGSRGLVGSLSPSLMYSEQPTIRYIPLQGQALVEQLITPISPTSLLNILSSGNYNVLPAIDLATAWKASPSIDDTEIAINAIAGLSALDRIGFEMTGDKPSSDKPPSLGATSAVGLDQVIKLSQDIVDLVKGPSGDNDLTIYLQPLSAFTQRSAFRKDDPNGECFVKNPDLPRIRDSLHLWSRLLYIYYKSQQWPDSSSKSIRDSSSKSIIERDKIPQYDEGIDRRCEFDPKSDGIPTTIRLYTNSTKPGKAAGRGVSDVLPPVLQLNSAIGILHMTIPGRDHDITPGGSHNDSNIDNSYPVAFILPSQLQELKEHPWNNLNVNQKQECPEHQFYVFWKKPDLSKPAEVNVDKFLSAVSLSRDSLPLSEKCLYVVHSAMLTGSDSDRQQAANDETELASRRKYLLIVVSDTLPLDNPPLVETRAEGPDGRTHYYYIDGQDEVSQKNFILMTQFLTIQAVAAAPTATPTIGIGAH